MRPAALIVTVSLVVAACATRGAAPTLAPTPHPAGPAAVPAPTTGPVAVSVDRLRADLSVLAADSMGGRATGGRGDDLAAAWMASELARAGLEPAGDGGSFYQDIPLARLALDTTTGLTVDGRLLRAGFDVLPAGLNLGWSLDSATAMYGGVTDDSTTWPSAAASAGKLLVMQPPAGADFNATMHSIFLLRRAGRFRHVAGFAVAALALTPPGLAQRLRAGQLTTDTLLFHLVRGSVLVSDASASALLGAPLATAVPGEVGPVVRGAVVFRRFPPPYPVRNVAAVLPGRDPALRATYVAITAHHGDGAGDGAPASAALAELARLLAAGPRPRRSILFVSHAAEELELAGSRWYTDHPTVPRDSIVADVNLDLLGRGGLVDQRGGIEVVDRTWLSTEFGALIDTVAAHEPAPLQLRDEGDAAGHPSQASCRADHYSYARYGIPAVSLATGGSPDGRGLVHEAQPVDDTTLARVTALVRDIALAAADLDHRLAVDGRRPDPRAPCAP
jgi:Peptidase family M28